MRRDMIITMVLVICLVFSGLAVVGSEIGEAQESVPVHSVEVSVELDQEAAIGAVYDGDYDMFMHSVDGAVYQGLREEWRRELETWTAFSSYNNLFINPAHEGKGTDEINEAIDNGWIEDPGDVQYLANNVSGEWTVNPFAHNDIRFALQYLNREKMVEDLLDGFGDPRYGFMAAHTDVWQERFVEPIEQNYGLSPEGNLTRVEEIIEDAMNEIMNEVAFGDVTGDLNGWYYTPPDGEEHQIEIKILGRVENWRLELARHMDSVLDDLGFDAWVEPVDSATAIPMAFFGSPEPYDNLDYHIYTGGWISSTAQYYQEEACSQMYAPWYGFMQTYGSDEHWQYNDEGYDDTIGPHQRVRDDWIDDPHQGKTVADMDTEALDLYAGQVETEEQYWDMKVNVSQMGFEESVRVFLLTQQSFYPYNPDHMLAAVAESINGYDTYFGPRTMRTDDGFLNTSVMTGEDRPFMDNWNKYGGSGDVYGEYSKRMVREEASWPHPRTGKPFEVNAYWSQGRETDPYQRTGNVEMDYEYDGGDLIENIEIPQDAVDYIPSDGDGNVVREWKNRDELINEGYIEDRYAAVKVIIDIHEEHVWHDGTNFSLQHVMANYAREKELANDTAEPYLWSWDAGKSPFYDSIHAIEWDEENGTYTVYGDYTFPVEDKVGSYYSMFPEVHPLTYEGWDHLHGQTDIYDKAGITETYDYEPGADNWIHQLSAAQNEDLVAILETIIGEEYLPPYLDEANNAPIPANLSQVENELTSLIDFIDAHDHSFVAAGPFYIEAYTGDNELIMERWNDYGYPFEGEEAGGVTFEYGYWPAQFEYSEARLDTIDAPAVVDLGTEFDVNASGHHAQLYPVPDESALTEDNMQDYRFTLRDELGGEILVEVGAEDITLDPQDTFTDFLATIPTAGIESGGYYELQLEVMGDNASTFKSLGTTVLIEDPSGSLVAHDWTIPQEVDVGTQENIWAEVENTAEENDTARIYLVNKDTGAEEMIYDEPVPAGSTIEIDYDHTFDTVGEFVVELRDDEDRWIEEFGEVTVLGPDIEALDLNVDPAYGQPPLESTIEVSAENNGTAAGTIDLEVDGAAIETFEIDAGQARYDTVDHTFDTEGTHMVTFGDLSSSVVVTEEPIVGVELNAPDEAVVGETATIEATVESFVEETTAHLYIAGVEEHVETLQGTGEHTFDYDYTFEQVGEVEVEVRSEGDTTVLSDNVTVLDIFELTVNSTEGGEVVEPGEGTFEYDHGTMVDIEAVADEGYHFVEWTGDNGTINDPTANSTTIEIMDNYTITAEFASTDYELTIDSTEGGEVVDPGEGTFGYQTGDLADLEAVPEEGYHFVRWSGDNGTIDDPTSNSTTIEIQDNHTITAEFAPDVYELALGSTEGGQVVEPGEETFEYEHGTLVDLEAAADEGYHFVEWTGDTESIEDPTSNSTAVEMLDDYVITADFEINTYTLAINSTENGNVIEPGEGTFEYDHGTEIALEAAADEGYHFVEWIGDNGTIDDPTSNSTTIEMLADYSITAEFAPTDYELTIDSAVGGEVVEPGEGTFGYQTGEIVPLEAVPEEGYHFVRWSGDNGTIDDTTANQTTVEMLDNYTITAEFAVTTHQLNVDLEGAGEVSVEYFEEVIIVEDAWSEELIEGTEVTLTAIPSDDREFSHWEGDHPENEEEESLIDIVMDGDKSLTAHFEEKEPVVEYYNLTIDSTEGGEVVEPGEGTFSYEEGTSVDLEAMAGPDYEFVEWTGDNGTIDDPTANQTTIEMLDNHTITARFEEEVVEDTYDLTVNLEGEGEVEVDPDQEEYEEGTEVTLTAVPDEGWTFSHWEGAYPEGEDTAETIEIVMDGDKELTANFVEEVATFEFSLFVEGEGNVTMEIRYEGEWHESEVSPIEDEWIAEDPGSNGTEIRLTANTPDGWEFSHWEGVPDDVDETEEQIVITLEEDMEITAHFEEESEPIDPMDYWWVLALIVALVVIAAVVAIFLKKEGSEPEEEEELEEPEEPEEPVEQEEEEIIEEVEGTEPEVEEMFQETEEEEL
ncbi:MAG: InlB B-repeat-containing protein [Candidatus Aenigmatarchaeota archaeon]